MPPPHPEGREGGTQAATPDAASTLARDAQPVLRFAPMPRKSPIRGANDNAGPEKHPPFCGCSDCETALLPKGAPIRIHTEHLRATFSPKDWRVTTTDVFTRPNGSTFKQDSHMYNGDKRSIPRAYAWARENAAKLPGMTRTQIYKALTAAGVKVDSHG